MNKVWNIPAGVEPFNDVLMMTVASESFALGHDPLYNNPQHPWNKKLNYPKIWHILFLLDIDRNHTNLIGCISVFLFFIGLGIFLLSDYYSHLTIFLIAIIVISPSIMLGIERGNIELIIFLILSLALLIGNHSSIAALLILIFASFLKLYPVFSFTYTLKENKDKFRVFFLSALSIFSIYMLFNWEDFKQIFSSTPKIAKSSYGLNVIWMGLTHPRILDMELSDTTILAVRILTYIILAIIFIAALLFAIKAGGSDRFKNDDYIDAFRIGAAIYIGCFILGNNFDYRFTFLIFTIPQLVSWLTTNRKTYSPFILTTLFSIVFSCWNYVVKRIVGMKTGFILEEISNWVLLYCLVYLFINSAPEWFIDYLKKPLLRLKLLKPSSVIYDA